MNAVVRRRVDVRASLVAVVVFGRVAVVRGGRRALLRIMSGFRTEVLVVASICCGLAIVVEGQLVVLVNLVELSGSTLIVGYYRESRLSLVGILFAIAVVLE